MRPVTITSTPFSGTMPSRGTAERQATARILAALVLEAEIDMPGRIPLHLGDLATHADATERALQRSLHRPRDFGDGVFGQVGDGAGGEFVHRHSLCYQPPGLKEG